MSHPAKVIVLGAGVIGLTTALRLRERLGDRTAIEMVAEQSGEHTLSRVAAASFYPFAVAHPRVGAWLEYGRSRFLELLDAGAPQSPGVVLSSGVILREGFEIEPQPIDGHAPAHYLLPSLSNPQRSGSTIDRFRLFIVEMPLYLAYLRARVLASGIEIQARRVRSFEDFQDAVVVNCTGCAAKRLVRDPELIPTFGQLVRVEAPEIERFALDERDAQAPSYIVPRSRDVVLGSIDRPFDIEACDYQPPPPDPVVTNDILTRCASLDPRVASARILEAYCGIRPRRSRVRVEFDRDLSTARRPIFHNYGHGGGGVTLSWGCADEVAGLLTAFLAGRLQRG